MIRLHPAHEAILKQLAAFGLRHDGAEPQHARRMLNLDWDTAEALHLMVRMAGYRRILEIGTSNGFSTLWLAAALPEDGHLTSIDRDHQKLKEARHNLERARLSHRVTLLEGDATALVAAVEGPFDCLFFDADRVTAAEQLELLLPKLAPTAAVFTDNVLSHPCETASYLARIEQDERFSSFTLPVGKGLHVALRH